MKQVILVIGFLGFSLGIFAQKTLPSVEVKTLAGETINITDYANNGKITILNFWATWCTPCKKELDALMDFYPEWRDDHGVEFIAITIDNARGLPKVPAIVKQKGWEYTILSDVKQELQNALSFRSVPQMFILNKKGEIVYSHSTYVPGFEYELDDKIKELAAEE